MITVSRKSGQLVWLEASNVPANTDVVVSEQTQALIVGDGEVANILYSGKTLINPKKKTGIFSSKPLFDRCDILGVDISLEVEIPWGVGGVAFMDEKLNCPGTIAASGTCTVKVSNGQKLHRKFFDGQNSVTAEFLVTKLRPIFCDKVKSVFTSVAAKAKEVSEITGKNIANDIEDNLYYELRENYGLEFVSIRYRINSNGLERLLEKLGEKAISGVDRDISINIGEGMKATAEGVKAFSTNSKDDDKKSNTLRIKGDE